MIFKFIHAHRLLTKERAAMEINMVKHDWMDLIYPEDIKKFDNIYGNKAVFPMHGALELKPRRRDVEKQLWRHCADLYNM